MSEFQTLNQEVADRSQHCLSNVMHAAAFLFRYGVASRDFDQVLLSHSKLILDQIAAVVQLAGLLELNR